MVGTAANGAPRGAPFTCEFRIYYEDTDASGVVYHANYLKLFERARTEYLRKLGFDQDSLRLEQDAVFTIADLKISYRVPARLDDRVRVSVHTSRLRRASLEFEQQMLRVGDGCVLASASVRAACVRHSDFRPRSMPPAVRAALASKAPE